MKIGNTELNGTLFLAPLAGYTDYPFRLLCQQQGADLTFTEMINAKALCYQDQKTIKMLETDPRETAVAVQIFGSEPEYMVKAAEQLNHMGRFVLIDVNMGCPAPKVVKNRDGCALMRYPEKAHEIIRRMKQNSDLPITVKFRLGWEKNNRNYFTFAQNMEDAGADAVTLHGRTRDQYYSGEADWDAVREVADALSIPVIGNGDIASPEGAKSRLENYATAAIMIGRGAMGNPLLFRRIKALLNKQEVPILTNADRLDFMMDHLQMEIDYKGELQAVKEMRKHFNHYLKGMPGSARLKDSLFHLEDAEKVRQTIQMYMRNLTIN